MNANKLRPLALRSGEARVYDHIEGDKITILFSGKDTGGAFAMLMEETPPGGGPPLHIHHHEDETFYVLEGELEMQVNEKRFVVSAGSSIFLPKGMPHTFRNAGTQTAKMLFLLTPAGLEEFFVEVEPLLSRGGPIMPEVLAIAGKYGIEAIGPPIAAISNQNGHQ